MESDEIKDFVLKSDNYNNIKDIISFYFQFSSMFTNKKIIIY